MSITEEKLEKKISEFVMQDPHLLKILLAEDDKILQKMVIKMLAEMIDAKKEFILKKQKIDFSGMLSTSQEIQDKGLILSLKAGEKTVLTIEIRLADDGNKAFDAFKEHNEKCNPFNFILMNYQMPNCKGDEAIRKIRAYENKLHPCLIIGWTSDNVYEELMKKAGANKCRRKDIASIVIEKLVVEDIFELPAISKTETFDGEQRQGFTP